MAWRRSDRDRGPLHETIVIRWECEPATTLNLLCYCAWRAAFHCWNLQHHGPSLARRRSSSGSMAMLMQQPSPPPDSSAAAPLSFLHRSAVACGPGLIRTDREHLHELERKLMEARQRFRDLKELEKCNASSKVCGYGCCRHGYARASDQRASSIGPEVSRSISETSNLPPAKKKVAGGGGRHHMTRSAVKAASLSASQETTGMAEHGSSPNAEPGLLLAVDKFLFTN